MISGLHYFPDIIDGDDIYDNIDESHFYSVGKSQNSREVIQYGLPFVYQGQKKSDIPVRKDFPTYIKNLRNLAIQKCEDLDLISKSPHPKLFNQCIINKYEPGQKIGAHIDAPSYGQVIACFSILSGISIVFKYEDEDEDVVKDLYIEANSLYIMSGESRWDWTHEIRGVKNDKVNGIKIPRETRISITFRSNKESSEIV